MSWTRIYKLIDEHKKHNEQLDYYVDDCNRNEEGGDGNVMNMYGYDIYHTEIKIQKLVNELMNQYNSELDAEYKNIDEGCDKEDVTEIPF